MTDWPAVSAVLTVLNEEKHLKAAVESVLHQDYPGEIEVIIALGPSRDHTDEVAKTLQAADPRVSSVANPSGRTPEGLNRALARARHPIVVRVDGHSELPRDYVGTAVRLLQRTGAVNVGGMMGATGRSHFEHAVAQAMTTRFGVGHAPFHVGGEEGPADTVYLGVFRRDALQAVGGYDEDFTRAQDWELNYRLREAGGLIWFSPALRVDYRPRGSVRSLAEQYFNYGRWRCRVMRRHPDTVTFRYLVPPVTLVAIVVGILAGAAGLAAGFPLLAWAFALPAGYLAAVLAVGAVSGGRELSVRSRLWLPAVYATMHMAWGTGFLSALRPYTRRSWR